jgi:hypothetical protein
MRLKQINPTIWGLGLQVYYWVLRPNYAQRFSRIVRACVSLADFVGRKAGQCDTNVFPGAYTVRSLAQQKSDISVYSYMNVPTLDILYTNICSLLVSLY